MNNVHQTPLHHGFNPVILDLMDRNYSYIVDVGCMSGSLAQQYKKLNPNCFYHGIDIMPEYTQIAKMHCDLAETLNIETATDEFFIKNSHADCWVFGDLVEHLVNPWGFIARLKMFLKKGAQLFFCIPNAQHWTFQKSVILGNFHYEDSGLLDRPHLFFFTKSTILDLLIKNDMQIKNIVNLVNSDPFSDPNFKFLVKYVETHGSDVSGYIEASTSYQYVIKCEVL